LFLTKKESGVYMLAYSKLLVGKSNGTKGGQI